MFQKYFQNIIPKITFNEDKIVILKKLRRCRFK